MLLRTEIRGDGAVHMPDIHYDEALRQYREMVANCVDEPVKGKANPYTSMNGNMYSFLDKSGRICLRLSKAEREAFGVRFGDEPVIQYGAVMKEYVALPTEIAGDLDAASGYFRLCFDYAKTLPVKKTKR